MLKFNAERVKRQALAREVEELRRECARLRLLAENREKETHKLRRRLAAGQSQSPPARDGGIMMGGEGGRYSPELAAGVLRPRYSGLGGASAGLFAAATAGLSSGESRGAPTYGSPPTSSGGDRRASRLSYLDMAVLEGSRHLRKERSSPRSSRLTSRGQCSMNQLSTDSVVDCTVTGSIDDDTECVGQSDYVAATSFSRNGISTPIAVNEPGGDFPRDQEGSLGEGIEVTGNQEDSCVEGDDGRTSVLTAEGEFSRIDAQSQAAFSGHTSPITRCRLSVSGANVASASVDGTVRIWTYEVGMPTTRNATLYCGAEVLSLEWDSKSDRLLLMGTAEGGIKAWNVDAKRVVCDLSVDASFPRVVDIKGSPTDAAFSCATSSARNAPSSYGSAMSGSQVDSVDHPKGTVAIWNMRVWKILNTLVLGEEPSLVLSLCYNHNGKILATAATDGLIRLFDMSSCSLITSWTAHRSCAASCVRFGYNHTSVFTLGSDGNVLLGAFVRHAST
ncbi:hypothetical protein CBR_g23333 [Chara braunii]|uniref:Anaphase-promoting complex subunit 4-like WD40 domain-containing protein n=1 Tax=Chara braunii TaxID=69332 RepID=A0A388L433_CHABU|nr:hypothetical protein CBR_g23333 [Chara braunii]|eukprot:GBG77002.1 hypothetical protein CBR_g23333 [Chara braunii]